MSKLRGYFTTLMTGIYQREKNEKLWKEISFTGWAEKKQNFVYISLRLTWLDLTWTEKKLILKWNEMTGNKSRWNFFSWKTILTLSKKKKNSVESSKTKWNESLCFVNTETLKPNLCFMRKRFFFKWLFLSRRKVFTTDHNSILLNIGKRRNTKDGPLFFRKDY